MDPNVLILSHPTYVGPSGATAAATYRFFTKGYHPPSEERYIESDVVKNQNGKFKYVYDNGPGFRRWSPFSIVCEDKFASEVSGATAGLQYEHLRTIWGFPGVFGMQAPEGTYLVHWSDNGLEHNFRVFPHTVNDRIEYEVVVQFEEGQ